MVNEALNNTDVTCIGNIMLNEVPTSNDAMCIANNVHLTMDNKCFYGLTTMDTQQFSMVVIAIAIVQKSRLARETCQRGEVMTR